MRWIIGDIHGLIRPLEALLARVQELDSRARFIFAGDYVNRGRNSAAVVDCLIRLAGAKFVRGNHDDVFDLIVNGACAVPMWGSPPPAPARAPAAVPATAATAAMAEAQGRAARALARQRGDAWHSFLNQGLLATLVSYG